MTAPWWETVRLAEARRLERVSGWRGAKAQDQRSPDWKKPREYAPARDLASGPRPVTTRLDGRVIGGPPRPAPAAPQQRTPDEQARRAKDMLQRSAPAGWRISGPGVARPPR
jgi:hypothetical protein